MAVAGRSISMFSLITDNILEPGDEVLTFDYLVRCLCLIKSVFVFRVNATLQIYFQRAQSVEMVKYMHHHMLGPLTVKMKLILIRRQPLGGDM